MFEISASEFGEVVSGHEFLKQLQKMWEKKQFGNNWQVEKRHTSVELVEPDPFLKKVD